MPKDKESFFEDEEDKDTEKKTDDEGSDKAPPTKETPPPTKEEDTTDWKKKYEESEKEKLHKSYYDELISFDDTLEGDSLDTVPVGKRYRELRDLGLTAREAYAAVMSEDETAPDKKSSNKEHVSPPSFRGTSPRSRMDRATREMMEDLLPDLSDEEKENLFRRVSGK